MQRFRGTLTEKFSVGNREPTQFPKAQVESDLCNGGLVRITC